MLPQPPQFSVSVAVLTHLPPHSCGAIAGHLHAPPAQSLPGLQAVVQSPQCVGSLSVSTQKPSQAICGESQARPPLLLLEVLAVVEPVVSPPEPPAAEVVN